MANLFMAEIADDGAAQKRVRAWIAALRSGRYTQASGYLRSGRGFCCLGVACDLCDSRRWVLDESEVMWSHLGYDSNLPVEVAAAYRLRTEDGGYGDHDQSSLIGNNDSGKTFPEIADLIERHLEAALAAGRQESTS